MEGGAAASAAKLRTKIGMEEAWALLSLFSKRFCKCLSCQKICRKLAGKGTCQERKQRPEAGGKGQGRERVPEQTNLGPTSSLPLQKTSLAHGGFCLSCPLYSTNLNGM